MNTKTYAPWNGDKMRKGRPGAGGTLSGYQTCACRDCFGIAIGEGAPALCRECKAADCACYDVSKVDDSPPGFFECQSPTAYGCDE